MSKNSEWFYFGCNNGCGHFLFDQNMNRVYFQNGSKLKNLGNFDGLLPPQDSHEGYIATVSRLEGYGMSALAFWDYSVDKRSQSNSIIFCPDLNTSPEKLLAEAKQRFPSVFGRMPKEVCLKID